MVHPWYQVISWFYYWRAGWNIVERIQAFPREPLPDPKRLRMDFDTCVAQGDRECTFLEGDGVHKYEDHRSQMSSFCGQERVCLSFNSEECLRQAKENVERYYSVVGVVEDMNKTLAVMERELPDIFSGASSLYYTE
jgi:dermatan/chondrotin sulfate uronyl 2-O-sulfotransferase UST